MATERELAGRPRQYIVLPVVRIIFRSLLLPFTYTPEVWKVSLITFAVVLATNLVGLSVRHFTEVGHNRLFQGSEMLIRAIVIAPFAVAWSKVALDETTSVQGFGTLPFGMTELWYAVANVAMWLLFLVPMFLFLRLITTARQAGDEAIMGAVGIFALTVVVAIALVQIRMSFLFPAIATGRYQGVRTAWTQTRGYLEALGAIEASVTIPFLIVWMLTRHFRSPGEGYLEWFALYALGDAVMLLWEVSFVAGPALAYAFLVLAKDGANATPRAMASGVS